MTSMNNMALCPVIINSSLREAGFLGYLGNGFKIRMSDNTPQDSVILPNCGIATLIVDVTKCINSSDTGEAIMQLPSPAVADVHSKSKKTCIDGKYKKNSKPPLSDNVALTHFSKESQAGQNSYKNVNKTEVNTEKCEVELENFDKLVTRIKAFMRGHKIVVVVIASSVFSSKSAGGKVMFDLQKKLMPIPPMILPAHGDAQIATHIQILSKVNQPDNRKVVQSRLDAIVSNVFMLDQNVLIGRAMGLSYHLASVLMDSFGSIENVATASALDIHQQTPLDEATAATVANFLFKDSVSQ